MKNIYKIIIAALIVGMVPISLATGQEKESEQRIKVIINDNGETTVMIDTLFTDDLLGDSIKIKNGKYIFIGKNDKDHKFMSGDDSENVFVTVSKNSKDTDKELSEIEIIKSGHADHAGSEKSGNHIVYNGDKVLVEKSGDSDKKMSWTVTDDDGEGENIIIIKDGNVLKTDGDNAYTYTIKSEKSVNKESDSESTKYVIRKDGMVISVEGEDYEKVKKLADEISSKIESKDEMTDKKAVKKK